MVLIYGANTLWYVLRATRQLFSDIWSQVQVVTVNIYLFYIISIKKSSWIYILHVYLAGRDENWRSNSKESLFTISSKGTKSMCLPKLARISISQFLEYLVYIFLNTIFGKWREFYFAKQFNGVWNVSILQWAYVRSTGQALLFWEAACSQQHLPRCSIPTFWNRFAYW